jgi:predicted nuclease of predicted toxin-antitoxin system
MNKFLVDAQLPRRLARMMQAKDLDVVHTNYFW